MDLDNLQFNIHPPRTIPYKLRGDVKKKLDQMLELGVIKKQELQRQ